MNILFCHNYYQQRGGEDQIFEDESSLLEQYGHRVIRFTKNNESIHSKNLLAVAKNTLWNRGVAKELTQLIERERPDVLHAINTFPLISPSIFHAAHRANVPVVTTVQNYRFFCAHSMCFRNETACEACLGRLPWRAVLYGCYRGSRTGSAVVATMQWLHRHWRTWHVYVDVICVASEFSKSKYVAAGLPEPQLKIKPNFVSPDPGQGKGQGGYAVFVGRLAGEKGVKTLLDAWEQLPFPIPLKIVGDGPQRDIVQAAAARFDHVEWLGRQPIQQVYHILGDAACLVFPSVAYESLPKTLIESLAVGTPAIGAKIGSIPEVVRDHETGFLFPSGNPRALAESVTRFWQQPETWASMRVRCRQEYETRYTAEANYRALIDLYQQAIARRHGSEATMAVPLSP